jgi:hypothetical protein
VSVSHDDDEVGPQRAEFGDEWFVAGAFGLEHRQIEPPGERFDERRLRLQVAAFGPVGLRDDSGDLELGIARQGGEAGAGQFRRAHENDSQRRHGNSENEIARQRKEKVARPAFNRNDSEKNLNHG